MGVLAKSCKDDRVRSKMYQQARGRPSPLPKISTMLVRIRTGSDICRPFRNLSMSAPCAQRGPKLRDSVHNPFPRDGPSAMLDAGMGLCNDGCATVAATIDCAC